MTSAGRSGWSVERTPRWTLVPAIVQEFRRRLAEHRQRFFQSPGVERASGVTKRPVLVKGSPTWPAGMSELTRLGPRARRSLDEILAAEQRIDAGVFGLCERCHRPISLRRLRAAPTTRACPRCSKPSTGLRART